MGMGRMGITHFLSSTHTLAVEVVSVSDTSKVVLDILRKNVPGIDVFTDYKEMIEQTRPDAVIVCTPPNFHNEVCQFACEKGVKRFCEKPSLSAPMMPSGSRKCFRPKGLIGQVGYVNRFNDMFATAREYVNGGLIGNVIRFPNPRCIAL